VSFAAPNLATGGVTWTMDEMRKRIEKLEQAAERKDQEHGDQIRALEEQQAAKDRLYEAQKAADRHRINNLNQSFQAMILLLKKGVPVEEVVIEIEAMRNEQLTREANEAATIRAAAIKSGLEGHSAAEQ
jgi:ribosomal protein L14E/L6E/L27E